MKKHLFAAIAVLALAGCADTTPRTASQGVYELESSLVVALKGANGYASLPRCDKAPQPCSEQSIVNQMADRAEQASTSVRAAQTAARTQGSDTVKANAAAQAAVASLQALVTANAKK